MDWPYNIAVKYRVMVVYVSESAQVNYPNVFLLEYMIHGETPTQYDARSRWGGTRTKLSQCHWHFHYSMYSNLSLILI